MALGPTDVHVWTLRLDGDLHPNLGQSVLSEDECARAMRFLSPRLRDAFVVGRSWVRRVLASYLRCGPGEVKFSVGRYGKPLLQAGTGLHCSWSHASGVWMLAVARGGPVGVDIEGVDSDLDWRQPASVAFHESERTFVQSAGNGPCRLERFYTVWTRKEALFKGLGLGLHDDMDRFAVAAADGRLHGVVPMPDGSRWRLRTLPEAPDFAAALAASFTTTRIVCCMERSR